MIELTEREKKKRSAKHISLEERFWFYTDKIDLDDCWEWKANKRNGYGRIYFDGRLHTAHRISWIIHFGEIPDKLKVLHKCDNPSCVNPYHLFLGTQEDNVHDMCNKNRNKYPIGEQVHKARLSRTSVIKIKRLYETGKFTLNKLAEDFKVSKGCISHIIKGRSWKWLEN